MSKSPTIPTNTIKMRISEYGGMRSVSVHNISCLGAVPSGTPLPASKWPHENALAVYFIGYAQNDSRQRFDVVTPTCRKTVHGNGQPALNN